MESKSKENHVLPTWATTITVAGGTNPGKIFLSCQQGGSVQLYSENDGSGRQDWVFHQLQPNVFNILVSGGTLPTCTFLSCSSDGVLVDLYDKDNGSGRQRWTLQKVSDGIYNIKVFGGVTDNRTFLSCTPLGLVDLWDIDDGSGRQRWKLTVPIIHVGFDIDQGEILSNIPQVVATQTLANSTSTKQSMSFQVAESLQDTSLFESSIEVSVSIGTSFEAGVPFVGNATISAELTDSSTQTYGKTTSVTKTVTATFPLVAPPQTKVICDAVVTKSKLKVPYSFTFADQSVESGTWYGVSAWGLVAQLTEKLLPVLDTKEEEKE